MDAGFLGKNVFFWVKITFYFFKLFFLGTNLLQTAGVTEASDRHQLDRFVNSFKHRLLDNSGER